MSTHRPTTYERAILKVVLRNPATSYKLAKQDFRDYGGKFKAIYVKVPYTHRTIYYVYYNTKTNHAGARRPEALHEHAQKQGSAAVALSP